MFGAPNTYKGRIVWNPTDYMKVVGGWINFNLIHALKKSKYVCINASPDDVAKKIKRKANKVKDRVFISMDFATFDAS